MTSGKLLKKYFWFLRVFQSGPITKEEIERRWVKSGLVEKGEKHTHCLYAARAATPCALGFENCAYLAKTSRVFHLNYDNFS